MKTVNMLVACACVVLAGCATTVDRMVTAPCPEPPKTERPQLEVLKLNKGDKPAAVMEAHRTDIKALQGYAVYLEYLLNAYRKEKENIAPAVILPEPTDPDPVPIPTISPHVKPGVVNAGNPKGKTPPPKRSQ